MCPSASFSTISRSFIALVTDWFPGGGRQHPAAAGAAGEGGVHMAVSHHADGDGHHPPEGAAHPGPDTEPITTDQR